MVGRSATSDGDDDITPTPPTAALSLDEFILVSRIVTAFSDLNDTATGQILLDALTSEPEISARLAELWTLGGFDSSEPPENFSDLSARGLYDGPELTALADLIAGNWYTGAYSTTDGNVHVATYITALAWRTLGYRRTGPSSCGGPFGYWASAPAA